MEETGILENPDSVTGCYLTLNQAVFWGAETAITSSYLGPCVRKRRTIRLFVSARGRGLPAHLKSSAAQNAEFDEERIAVVVPTAPPFSFATALAARVVQSRTGH